MFLSEKVFRLKNIFVIAMKTVSSRASSPFVQNVLRLFDASLRGSLSASSSHLYVHLLALQNRRGWCEWLCVSDRVLAVSCGMTARTVGRCRDEQLRQEELEKARREEESRQAWLRVKAEMQQQAAAGDPHALRVMEQFRDVIESDAGLPAVRKEGGV